MNLVKLEWLMVLEDRMMEKEGVDDNSYLGSMQAMIDSQSTRSCRSLEEIG